MQIKWTGCLLATAFLTLAGCQGETLADGSEPSLGHQEANATSQCVEKFPGIKSCATGAAKIEDSDKGFKVTGLKNPKTDGISSTFAGAVKWSQDATIENFGAASLAANDGTQTVSTLQIARGKVENQIALQPGFTGSPNSDYTVNVYRAGQLQASINQPSTRIIYIWWWDWWWWSWIHWGFYQVRAADNVGACVWSASAVQGNTFTVSLDGKDVVGDSIEFVENIKAGAYPYNQFTGIDVKGAATGYTVLNESISRE